MKSHVADTGQKRITIWLESYGTGKGLERLKTAMRWENRCLRLSTNSSHVGRWRACWRSVTDYWHETIQGCMNVTATTSVTQCHRATAPPRHTRGDLCCHSCISFLFSPRKLTQRHSDALTVICAVIHAYTSSSHPESWNNGFGARI